MPYEILTKTDVFLSKKTSGNFHKKLSGREMRRYINKRMKKTNNENNSLLIRKMLLGDNLL